MKNIALAFAGIWILALILIMLFQPAWRLAAVAMLATPVAMLLIIILPTHRK